MKKTELKNIIKECIVKEAYYKGQPNEDSYTYTASDGKTYKLIVDEERGEDNIEYWHTIELPSGEQKHLALANYLVNRFATFELWVELYIKSKGKIGFSPDATAAHGSWCDDCLSDWAKKNNIDVNIHKLKEVIREYINKHKI